MIHVALADAYPTEAEARTALQDQSAYVAEGAHLAGTQAPYRGVWRMAQPYRTKVHVFSEITAEDLEVLGWIRDDA